MTTLLGFIFECIAIATLIALAVSALVLAGAALLRPLWAHLRPSSRGDVTLLAAVAPAIASVAGTLSVAAPPIASALGLAGDHCLEHGHHLHVCLVHHDALRPELIGLGVAALSVWLVRAHSLIARLRQTRRNTTELERLGTFTDAPFPVLQIPGTPRLCHAVGSFRRRVLVSAELVGAIDASALRCVLAHEFAHLRRRDPLANTVIAIAGLFTLPAADRLLQRAYRSAAEHACDDEATAAVGDGTLVASALVTVASVQHHALQPDIAGLPGFGEHPLEARVRRLLEGGSETPRPAYGLSIATCIAMGALVTALHHATALHHGVETALHHLF